MTAMPRAAEAAHYFPDVASAEPRSQAVSPETECASVLRVSAEADPNILARIVQPMVKLDLFPLSLNVASDDSGLMLAEIAFRASDEAQVKRLQSILQAVIGIVTVEHLSRNHHAVAAAAE